ncbi:MAG: radical SAM protein, partial [Acidobacteriota bacterium]
SLQPSAIPQANRRDGPAAVIEPVLADVPLFFSRMLNYAPSWYCASRCRHCCVPLKARRQDGFDLSIAKRLVRELPEYVRVVGLTGGEPLSVPERFLKLIEMVHRAARSSIVVTHAYRVLSLGDWQGFFLEAQKLGLMSISLSVDDYHRPAVPEDALVQLVMELHEMGFQIHLKGTGVNSRKTIRRIRGRAGFKGRVAVTETANLDNVGSARKLKRDRIRRPERRSCVGILSPLVTPGGDLMACCSSYLEEMSDTMIRRGNIRSKSLRTLLDEYSKDFLVGAIAYFGPFALRKLVGAREIPGDPSRCRACMTTLRDRDFMARLRGRLVESKSLRKQIAGALLAYEKFYRPRFIDIAEWDV